MAKRTISIDKLDRLGIDPETDKLYWDGKEIVTAMSLPWWVQVAAVVTAIATSIIAIASIIPFVQAI